MKLEFHILAQLHSLKMTACMPVETCGCLTLAAYLKYSFTELLYNESSCFGEKSGLTPHTLAGLRNRVAFSEMHLVVVFQRSRDSI